LLQVGFVLAPPSQGPVAFFQFIECLAQFVESALGLFAHALSNLLPVDAAHGLSCGAHGLLDGAQDLVEQPARGVRAAVAVRLARLAFGLRRGRRDFVQRVN